MEVLPNGVLPAKWMRHTAECIRVQCGKSACELRANLSMLLSSCSEITRPICLEPYPLFWLFPGRQILMGYSDN